MFDDLKAGQVGGWLLGLFVALDAPRVYSVAACHQRVPGRARLQREITW